MAKTVNIKLRIDEETLAWLTQNCAKHERSVAGEIRLAIRKHRESIELLERVVFDGDKASA